MIRTQLLLVITFLTVCTMSLPMERYSQTDLVDARIAWANQENRLSSLKYEAKEIAHNHKVEYFNGPEHVATIDANDESITTHLSEDNKVVLSFDEFRTLLTDSNIVNLANKKLLELAS